MYKVKECPHCEGKGYRVSKGVGAYRFGRVKCYKCRGTGQLKIEIKDRYTSVKQNLY